ncbi:hypothetical protein K440DRAFT_313549 [Wilcoxina mikolae CBS 423.85]|nr:hypothetical protein K440DRAFT_313549 [Wilcoxina mikolae CBS 423.85]
MRKRLFVLFIARPCMNTKPAVLLPSVSRHHHHSQANTIPTLRSSEAAKFINDYFFSCHAMALHFSGFGCIYGFFLFSDMIGRSFFFFKGKHELHAYTNRYIYITPIFCKWVGVILVLAVSTLEERLFFFGVFGVCGLSILEGYIDDLGGAREERDV